MRRMTKIVLAVAVVGILIVGYMAFVGETKAAPDTGAQKDPTGQNRAPIAYAVINIHCDAILNINWVGHINSISVQTYPWVNGTPAINQVTKWDLMGLFSSNFKGWISLRITGPSNYLPATYTSPTQQVTQDAFDFSARKMDFGPYTAKFWDAGQYTITVKFLTAGNDGVDKQLASLTQTFSISGGI